MLTEHTEMHQLNKDVESQERQVELNVKEIL